MPGAATVLLGHIRTVRLACQPTNQQYCSLILNQHQPPATNQSAVLFSHNKSASTTSHSQANTTMEAEKCYLFPGAGVDKYENSYKRCAGADRRIVMYLSLCSCIICWMFLTSSIGFWTDSGCYAQTKTCADAIETKISDFEGNNVHLLC